MIRKSWLIGCLCCSLVSSAIAETWNSPHAQKTASNVRHAAFIGAPKTLDPARAYSSNELQFIAQIYEPPFQYHYLKRPYVLIPLTATTVAEPVYYDQAGHQLPHSIDPKKVAYSLYTIQIKPGILYQPHPAFAKDQKGRFLYHHLTKEQLYSIHDLNDFKKSGTRELTADDYVYEIKRLASPNLNSPIFGLMSQYIIGLTSYRNHLGEMDRKRKNKKAFLDLRQFSITGVKALDRYRYQIKIKGVYAQFKYWLAMPFFAPIPWEADAFYSQPGFDDKNLNFNWYPVGTGPYQLIKNNPNKKMVLTKNPYFHSEYYPKDGEVGDKEKGYLDLAGQRLPFIDTIVFSLDKESIPRWNKFLQGYYDKSSVSDDSFDQAISIEPQGKADLTPEMKQLGIELQTTVSPSIYYVGFNMLDPVVGGYTDQKRKLRRAISIALDYEEYIAIFMNGRGRAAQGPIPPGIAGYESGSKGINPYVYNWFDGKAKRKSIQEAKRLLAEAGYRGGVDPKTHKPLILNYDVSTSGNPDDKAHFNWIRKQFAKLGITLNIRATLYNRFQDKVRTGNAQIFSWGWSADYPDPENFLFLLYGPYNKVKQGGENATNYESPEFDRLFESIRNMPEGAARQQKIHQAVHLLRKDAPWVWGFHAIHFTLSHQWNAPAKPNAMAGNTLKYEKINFKERALFRHQWNQPVMWPILFLLVFLSLSIVPLVVMYWRRERRPAIKRYSESTKKRKK